MPKRSAGLLLHRTTADGVVEVLVVHPGGPFWAKKDEGAWSVPKGEHDDGEDAHAAAHREFAEELGSPAPDGPEVPLGELRQPSGKRVTCWAVAADFDPTGFTSNDFEVEWPPRSGRIQAFPEVDRAEWCTVAEARTKLLKGQVPFLDALLAHLGPGHREG